MAKLQWEKAARRDRMNAQTRASRGASPAQRSLITTLSQELGLKPVVPKKMTVSQASAEIKKLLAIKKAR